MTQKYQTQFEINRSELDIIETALRSQATTLSLKTLSVHEQNVEESKQVEHELHSRMSDIQSVLGKLHNQKKWFVPKQYVPLG